MPDNVKRCVKCRGIFPMEMFNKKQRYCKSCKSTADKKHRMTKILDESKNVFPYTYSKVCGNCHTNKSLDDFYPSATALDGRQSYCKKCSREFDKQQQEVKKIKRELRKKQYQTQSQFNNQGYFETLRGGNHNAGRPNADLLELTPERLEFLNIQRDEWRKVFAERFDDIVILMKAYEANPENSVQLITDFHDNVRPKWKLQHKTPKQLKNEYYEFLRNKYSTSIIDGNNSGNESN